MEPDSADPSPTRRPEFASRDDFAPWTRTLPLRTMIVYGEDHNPQDCTATYHVAGNCLESANATLGVVSVLIGDRNPTGNVDPEMVLVATHDFYGRLTGGNTGRMAFTLGSSSGNTVKMTLPTVEYANVQGGDRGGILIAGLDYEAKSATVDSTDHDAQIVMI